MKKLLALIFIFWLPLQVSAALTFGANTTDRVNFGSGASLDQMNTQTVAMWVYVTTITNNRTFYLKGPSGSFNKMFRIQTGGNLQVAVNGATLTNYITNDTPLSSTNTWAFIAFTYDTAGGVGEEVNIYKGSLTALAVESTYGTSANGTVPNNDAANSVFIGNSATLDAAIQGRIAWFGIWNRVLTLQEIITQQFNPHVSSGNVLFSHLGFNGVSTQPDWSGNANNGTVTGATYAYGGHAPIKIR